MRTSDKKSDELTNEFYTSDKNRSGENPFYRIKKHEIRNGSQDEAIFATAEFYPIARGRRKSSTNFLHDIKRRTKKVSLSFFFDSKSC